MALVQERVVHQDSKFRIIRRGSMGKTDPAYVKIYVSSKLRGQPNNTRRNLMLTVDELFELTEILDDLCDVIEDETK